MPDRWPRSAYLQAARQARTASELFERCCEYEAKINADERDARIAEEQIDDLSAELAELRLQLKQAKEEVERLKGLTVTPVEAAIARAADDAIIPILVALGIQQVAVPEGTDLQKVALDEIEKLKRIEQIERSCR